MSGKSSREGGSRQALAGITTYVAAGLLLATALPAIGLGIAALLDNRVVIIAPNYVFTFDTRLWGAIHLIVGITAGAIAVGMFWGTAWARIAAVTIASLSIVSMFFWLSTSPFWSIVTIVLDIAVVWAVLTWQSPRARAKSTGSGPQ
jgi:hypothetical protein